MRLFPRWTKDDYLTIQEFCSENDIDYTMSVLAHMSHRATDMCMDRGIELKTVTALRPWQINAYPKTILEEIVRECNSINRHFKSEERGMIQ
jgi:hypothetical protein